MKKVVGVLFALGLLTAVAVVLMGRPAAEVRGKSAAMPIAAQMTPEQQLAQDLALADERVQAATNGRRSEVFGVSRVALGPYPDSLRACATADCRQVEIYLWDEDTAVTAFVHLASETVLDVYVQPHSRPGINKRLHDLSLEIATNAPEVIEALGYRPAADKVLVSVDAGMPDSACAGDHLCVAPTFQADDGRILWVMVDLTAEEVAGIGLVEAAPPGEFEPFVPTDCGEANTVTRNGWSLSYITTNHDGLNVYSATYNGVPVFTSIKLAEWHAHYPTFGFQDSIGCSGGGGGFTIYPYGSTQVLDLLDEQSNVIGFEVVQDFRMSLWGQSCNYRYEQRFRFFNDGRFRPVSGAYGKGCQTDATYRPVVRMDIAVNGDDHDRFARWDGAAWQTMTVEDYLVPYAEPDHGPHEIDPDGYSWFVEDVGSGLGYAIEQDVGQFDGDRGRGANPFVYPTLHHPEEGDGDLYVFSSGCCNDDHQQGPHLYLNGENIYNENIVLWYVPQAETDAVEPDLYCWTISGEPNPETYPCFMGPMFVPTGLPIPGFSYPEPVGVNLPVEFSNETVSNSATTYEWHFGDGSPVTTGYTATHTFAQEGDFTVTLTATNPTGSAVYTDSVTVVGIPPTAVFTHMPGGWMDQPIPFTNLSTGSPPFTYTWDFGDGSPLATAENPTHTYTMTGTFTITLTVTNSWGVNNAISTIGIQEYPYNTFLYLPVALKP